MIRKLDIIHAGTAVLTACAAWAVFFFINPTAKSFLPSCPFHVLTGLYCPVCGTTRALHQLAHGNLLAALQFNALAVCGLLAGVFFVLCSKPMKVPEWCRWAVFWIVVTFGVLRNIPIYPFNLLAP